MPVPTPIRSEQPRGVPPEQGNGNGSGFDSRLRDLEVRLASLETKVDGIKENMATGEDIQALKTLIAEKEAAQTKWLLGILATTVIAITVAMLRLFSD